jgi:hypothetical protein
MINLYKYFLIVPFVFTWNKTVYLLILYPDWNTGIEHEEKSPLHERNLIFSSLCDYRMTYIWLDIYFYHQLTYYMKICIHCFRIICIIHNMPWAIYICKPIQIFTMYYNQNQEVVNGWLIKYHGTNLLSFGWQCTVYIACQRYYVFVVHVYWCRRW